MMLCLATLTDLQTRRAGLSASAELLDYPHNVVSAVYATATWLAVCHTPVLYQND